MCPQYFPGLRLPLLTILAQEDYGSQGCEAWPGLASQITLLFLYPDGVWGASATEQRSPALGESLLPSRGKETHLVPAIDVPRG